MTCPDCTEYSLCKACKIDCWKAYDARFGTDTRAVIEAAEARKRAWEARQPPPLRLRLHLTREHGPSWLRMLALCAWLRGGIVDPAALEGA